MRSAFTVGAALLIGVLLLMMVHAPQPPGPAAGADAAGRPASAAPAAVAPLREVASAAAGLGGLVRSGLGAQAGDADAAAPDGEPGASFEELVERLVALGLRCRRFVGEAGAQRSPELQAAVREAEQIWAALGEIRDRAERALLLLAGMEPGAAGPSVQLRRQVCLRLLREGLARQWRAAMSTGERGDVDQLVAGLLAAVPHDEQTAADCASLLVDQPYLGLAHEQAVLDLVAAAAEVEFLEPVASELLLTLWHNLEAEKARTSAEILALALLFRQDANPSRRLAALEQLLVMQDGRYREIAIRDVLEQRDRQTAARVASVAAARLAPPEALQVLTRLLPVAKDHLMGAFLVLGERDETVLREAYDRQLAQNSNASLRAELVTGMCCRASEQGIEMARLAFAYDPDPDVRSRAMFALTAHAASALGEQTLMAALDDPVFSADPGRLSQIGAALENLASAGEVNAVDRVGRRLLARAELRPDDRERIARLLERVLPKGW